MKAAKDGQGGENCGELYPKCDSDTDSVSSLPMVKIFEKTNYSQLLSSLMDYEHKYNESDWVWFHNRLQLSINFPNL